jgi:hypothetical protein
MLKETEAILKRPGHFRALMGVTHYETSGAAGLRKALALPIDGRGPRPHQYALRQFFQCTDERDRNEWASVLHELIVLGPDVAPTDVGEDTALWHFIWADWTSTPECLAKLTQSYISAGFIRHDVRLPGELPLARGAMRTNEGLTPLAAAIVFERTQLVRQFLAAGASLNIGPVERDGADCDAIEFAAARSTPDILSTLTAHAMRLRVAASTSGAPTTSPDRSSPRVPARRRMGV